MSSHLSVALTIAGSDSGGGAGIQADLKTFQAFGVYGTSAVTAVTAQNTLGVVAVHPVPLAVVRSQIRAVATDLHPGAVKSGMLATGRLVACVGEAIREHGLVNYVLDPVMIASSGERLLEEKAEHMIAEHLLPLATVVTPNLHEARRLTGLDVDGVEGMAQAARRLVGMGASAALVKGGHLEGREAVDVLWDGRSETIWKRPRLPGGDRHGTGCTLSAAISAGLARGLPLTEAVDLAVDFVARALAEAPGLGSGHGPLSHFVPSGLAAGTTSLGPVRE